MAMSVFFLISYTIQGCPKGQSPVNDPVQNAKSFFNPFSRKLQKKDLLLSPIISSNW